jgi:rhodanese-related sulfurtransferase
VLSAQDLYDNLSEYTVIDIRSQQAYDDGHIPGAVHSSLGTLVADLDGGAIPSGKPYVVACYTGQSAGHAKIAMEMLGYGDVYSLLFGMSSWNSSLSAPWDGGCQNYLTNVDDVNNNVDLTEQTFPNLTENPQTVVRDRVEWMLSQGFKGKSYSSIQGNESAYFIINYFGEADYMGTGSAGVPGHIPGAFQFTPYASMGYTEMLKYIPKDQEVIVYCWTGQHSSQVTAYLNMLGYDAYSLTFGSNNLFHDQLTAHKWTDGAKHEFPLETSPIP